MTTCAPPGSSVGSTSTSCCSSTSSGSSAAATATTSSSLVDELSQPLVVTLHTVLSEPTKHQAKVLAAVCRQAELVIVMTDTARRLLVDGGTCPDSKVRVVPHGAPTGDRAARRRVCVGARRRRRRPQRPRRTAPTDERFLLSTFGLISAGKGLETAIAALPAIVERHPEVLYVIAGRTHPGHRAP